MKIVEFSSSVIEIKVKCETEPMTLLLPQAWKKTVWNFIELL